MVLQYVDRRKNKTQKKIKVGGAETIITDENIYILVSAYFFDKEKLPADLQNVLIGKWNVSRVTDMNELFYDPQGRTYIFGEADSLDEWDVSHVEKMHYMFRECQFTYPININSWNVEKVQHFKGMFWKSDFNQPLDNWKPISAKNMDGMFYGCSQFNQPLNTWVLKKVKDMTNMFSGCTNFNQPLDKWFVGYVKNMNRMFENCIAFDQDLGDWDVSRVEEFNGVFDGCPIKPYHMPMKFRRIRYSPAPASVQKQETSAQAPQTSVPPPELPTMIDVTQTGNDFIDGNPTKSIQEFINESLAEKEEPIIIKIIENTEHASYKLLTVKTFETLNNSDDINNNHVVVYPCWQDSNFYKITDYILDGDGSRVPIPVPEGLIVNSSLNVRQDTPLISLQQLFDFRGCVYYYDFMKAIREQTPGPVFMSLYFDGETAPAIAKIPFVVDIGKLHCNREVHPTPEKIWKIMVPETNYVAGGGKLKKKSRKLTRKKKQVKTKQRKTMRKMKKTKTTRKKGSRVQ